MKRRISRKSEQSDCFCGRASTGFMICCDLCDRWCHGRCVRVTETAAKGLDKWFCKYCSNIRRLLEERHSDTCRRIKTIETNVDQLRASVDLSFKRIDSDILRVTTPINGIHAAELQQNNNSQLLEDQNHKEKEKFQTKIRCLEKQIYELESNLKTSTKAYEDSVVQQSQMKELNGNLTQEKEDLSFQLIQLREENSVLKTEVEQLKDEVSELTFHLGNMRKEKEAVSLQLADLEQKENKALEKLEAENASLKERVMRLQKRSRLSLSGNPK